MKKVQLFDKSKKNVGIAEFHKSNGLVKVNYDDSKIHYANVTLEFDEFEDYKQSMQLLTEYDIGQISLF